MLQAGAFYGFKVVIIPHNLPAETLAAHLQTAKADALIAEAGSLDLSTATKGNKQLTQVVWVAKYGNRHMDWHDVPAELKGSMEVEVWHELVDSKKDLSGLEIPEYDASKPTPGLSTVWPSDTLSGKFIDFEPEVSDISSRLITFHTNRQPRTSSLLSAHWAQCCLEANVSVPPTSSFLLTLFRARTLSAKF